MNVEALREPAQEGNPGGEDAAVAPPLPTTQRLHIRQQFQRVAETSTQYATSPTSESAVGQNQTEAPNPTTVLATES